MKHKIIQIDVLMFNKVRGNILNGNKIETRFYNITDKVKKIIKRDMENHKACSYRCTLVNDTIVDISLGKFSIVKEVSK